MRGTRVIGILPKPLHKGLRLKPEMHLLLGQRKHTWSPDDPFSSDEHWDNVWSLVHFEAYDEAGSGTAYLTCEKGKTLMSIGQVDESNLLDESGVFGKGWSAKTQEWETIAHLYYGEEINWLQMGVFTAEMRVRFTGDWNGYVFAYGGGMMRINRSSSGELTAGFPWGQIITDWDFAQPGIWYSLAIVCDGSTAYFFIDGELFGTAPGVFTNDVNMPVHLAKYTSEDGNVEIDEFRLTLGVARYTEPYTLASAPFPSHA